jgi:pyroglutamyl-peptidase
MSEDRSRCVVLLTGFAPFGDLRRNPSADVVRRLARDASLRRLGLRTAVLPVDRRNAPRRLDELVDRRQPRVLLLTGVAAGRPAISVERIAVNCYRRPGDQGAGRPIAPAGPDGLFVTIPLERSVALLRDSGAAAGISETAGTFACNLILYHALWRVHGGRGPLAIGFVHLPATPESLPEGDARPAEALVTLARGVAALVRGLARVVREKG